MNKHIGVGSLEMLQTNKQKEDRKEIIKKNCFEEKEVCSVLFKKQTYPKSNIFDK